MRDAAQICYSDRYETFTQLKLLGVTLDASLSFDKHVTNVVRACTFHTLSLIHI